MVDNKMSTHNTKEQILNTAREIFAESGYEGARMDLIAQRAGVNKAGIYYHIGGKERLYEMVLQTTFSVMFNRVARAVDAQDTPQEKLRAYVRGFLRNMKEHPYLPPIMLREIATGGKHISKPLVDDFAKILDCLSAILSAGEQAGVFVKTTPIVVHFLIISTNAYLLTINTGRKTSQTDFSRAFEAELTTPDIQGEIEGLVMRSILTIPEGV